MMGKFDELPNEEKLEILINSISATKKKIKNYNTDKRNKTKSIYPNHAGYTAYVKRPVRDILGWMNNVEEILEILIDEIMK